ncbi:MAG: single-stranded DNA-binding protein [Rikenellaceae bacterium]
MINKVILLGNVGADPEVHVFESGNKIVRIRLATTERIYNPTTTTWNDHTEWHHVIIGQRNANFAEMYIKKGSQVYVEGKIRRREWGEQDDKRYSYEIRADEIRLLGGRRNDSSEMRSESPVQSQSSEQPSAQQQQQQQQQQLLQQLQQLLLPLRQAPQARRRPQPAHPVPTASKSAT